MHELAQVPRGYRPGCRGPSPSASESSFGLTSRVAGQDRFGQLQALHRLVEQLFRQSPRRGRRRRPCRGFRPARRPARRSSRHRRCRRAGARTDSIAAYSRPSLGETGNCLRAWRTLSWVASSSRRRTPRSCSARACAGSANTARSTDLAAVHQRRIGGHAGGAGQLRAGIGCVGKGRAGPCRARRSPALSAKARSARAPNLSCSRARSRDIASRLAVAFAQAAGSSAGAAAIAASSKSSACDRRAGAAGQEARQRPGERIGLRLRMRLEEGAGEVRRRHVVAAQRLGQADGSARPPSPRPGPAPARTGAPDRAPLSRCSGRSRVTPSSSAPGSKR